MSRSIYLALVRHAATEWTAAGRIQGRNDPPLSPEGEAQALGWRLPADLARLQTTGELGWAASPLQRTAATAHKLGAIAPRFDSRLVERHYGVWQGRPLAEVEASLENGGWESRPAGGESSGEVLARVRAWLDELAVSPGPETWVVVTHLGVIRALLAATVGWDLRDPAPFRLLPERLHRIRRRGDGHLQLVTLNEPLVAP